MRCFRHGAALMLSLLTALGAAPLAAQAAGLDATERKSLKAREPAQLRGLRAGERAQGSMYLLPAEARALGSRDALLSAMRAGASKHGDRWANLEIAGLRAAWNSRRRVDHGPACRGADLAARE